MSSTARRTGNNAFQGVIESIIDILVAIPSSDEASSATPWVRARSLVASAAKKTAVLAGTLALPPGPFGLISMLPQLAGVWRIQAKLVSDVAACFGGRASLTKEGMMWCLFKHSGAQVLRDVVVQAGDRILIHRASLRAMQDALGRVGISVAERVVTRALSTWIPAIGAVGVGAYAYYDTTLVGRTAMNLFSGEVVVDESPGQGHNED